MIDRSTLLSDLQKLLQRLEADLLKRSNSAEVPEVGERLRGEYERAKKAERTAMNYEDWRSATITQNAAAWVLSCVFVRFLEDNRLIDPPKIAGPGERLRQARDEWELYLGQAKQPNERDYLLGVFDELARLPGGKDIFGEHNPVHELPNWLSGDGARELLTFFQKIDPESGALVHDFTDPDWETRFLGDLYQDLSEAARKRYALLQTPEFVEEFILQRTLEPALDEFGLEGNRGDAETLRKENDHKSSASPRLCGESPSHFRMIDPACGSGHFLLGSFRRILDRWQKHDPGAGIRELVGRTLNAIHGVDINPYAVAITRFRLLLAAMRECGVTRLADAPAFEFNLACGDSLLHGAGASDQRLMDHAEDAHYYEGEHMDALRRILQPGRYHAVVANPPYITPKDKALNQAYRDRYSTCHMKYALTVPFMQRLFQLAASGYGGAASQGGYVGQITSNSFMKREFGKKLIEQYLAGRDGGPSVDLTHVIDTSGAYIPGHGTPTVILFGRNRAAVVKTIRTVMGIRGEPSTPADPARGLVWSAIVAQIDQPGSQSEFVSVADSPRELFAKHPWSIGGGGAAELKEQLDNTAVNTFDRVAEEMGVLGMTNADEVMLAPFAAFRRRGVEHNVFRRLALGDEVRDWRIAEGDAALFPYTDDSLIPIGDVPGLNRWLWIARTVLGNRATFARATYFLEGRPWWEWHQIALRRLRTPLSIVYGEVATHNHFVLDRGGKVFNRTAPVIKLPPEATEDDHLALLGLLNSSTACFWMKQVSTCKGLGGQGGGIKPEDWHRAYAFNGTKLLSFPIPEGWRRCADFARRLDCLAQRVREVAPAAVLAQHEGDLRTELHRAKQKEAGLYRQMVALQEDLDWLVYEIFGLCVFQPIPDTALLDGLHPQDRPAEEILRNKMAKGEPSIFYDVQVDRGADRAGDLTPEMRSVNEARLRAIESSRDLQLVETPNSKRRWQVSPWSRRVARACEGFLLDRLESYFDFDGRMAGEGQRDRGAEGQREKHSAPLPLCSFAPASLATTAHLADVAGRDPQFMEVGEVYRDDKAFDVQRLVEELVTAESVPLLPVLRYKPAGLRKRAEWEKTWELQREEDQRGKGAEGQGEWQRGRGAEGQGEWQRAKGAEGQGEWQRAKGAEGQSEEHSGPLPLSHSAPLLDIPVPPKYTSADFLSSSYWRLRGKLDVPKERWLSFPHCEGPDGTLVIAWAGYDHLQLARAISAYYVDVQERLGGRDDPRLVPLLAGLIELLPWLKQWHNEPDAAFDGMRMGDYFEGFVQEEARQLGKTVPEIKAWEPPKKSGGRKRKVKSK